MLALFTTIWHTTTILFLHQLLRSLLAPRKSLTVSAQLEHLALLPVGSAGRTDLDRRLATAVQTTSLASRAGETTQLAVLMHRIADPVDAGIIPNHLVHRIHQNALVPLVYGVLGDPVRVQDAQGAKFASHALFGHRFQVSARLNFLHTTGRGLSVADSLGDLALTTTALDTNPVHNIPLLGLVAQAARLVRTSWTRRAVYRGQLTKFPCADTRQKAHHIALLFFPELFQVLVGAHLVVFGRRLAICAH